jgi:hypothetical protein
MDCDTDTVLARALFSAHSRTATWQDLLICAAVTGALAPLHSRFASGQTARQAADAAGEELGEETLHGELTRLRYGLNLISADETGEWLAERELSLMDVQAYLERQHWAACAAGEEPVGVGTPADLWEEAALSGVLDQLLIDAAHRAVAAAARPAPAETRIAEARRRWDGAAQQLLAGLQPPAADVTYWLHADAALQQLRAEHLHSRDAASELQMCITVDGETMAAAAARAGITADSGQLLLCDVDTALARSLRSAAVTDCVLADRNGSGATVYQVLDKVEPSLKIEAVRQRLEDRCLTEWLQPRVAAEVRWLRWECAQ